jgi:DnaJ-class molecular chaperone
MTRKARVMVCPECAAGWFRSKDGGDPFDRCPQCSNEASITGEGGPFEVNLVEACPKCNGKGYLKDGKAPLEVEHE